MQLYKYSPSDPSVLVLEVTPVNSLPRWEMSPSETGGDGVELFVCGVSELLSPKITVATQVESQKPHLPKREKLEN